VRLFRRDRALAELLDRQAIYDCVHRYSRGVDRLDEDILLSAFHPDAVADYGTARANFVGSAREFVAWALPRNRQLLDGSLHYLMNHVSDVDGDSAHAETYFLTVLAIREHGRVRLGGGRYVDRLERRNGEWRIAARVVLGEWSTVVDPDATDDVPPHRPARDRSDVSYARPLVTREPPDHAG
jgi:hypothetical protein